MSNIDSKSPEIRRRALLAAGGGGLVGFALPEMPHARTLEDKPAEKISIIDFGAVEGDGTDNSVAIQKGLDYLQRDNFQYSGGILDFPEGMWVSRPLHTGQDATRLGRVSFRGRGINTNLRLADGSDDYLLNPKNGYFSIENMHLDGNSKNNAGASGVLNLDKTNFFTALRNVRIKDGREYGIKAVGGNACTLDNSQVFGSGVGIYLKNFTCFNIVNGSTIEDNWNGGIKLQGSGNRTTLNIIGAYLENNDRNAGGAAHIDINAMRAQHKLVLIGSLLNGLQSKQTQVGIAFSGTPQMIDNNLIKSNVFNELAASFSFSNIGKSNVGLNDIRGNEYLSCPQPSPTNGFLIDDSEEFILYSDELDLSGNNLTLPLMPFAGARPFRIVELLEHYTKASGKDTGVALRVGWNGAPAGIYSGTSAVNQKTDTIIDRLAEPVHFKSDASGRVLNVATDGGKRGTGAVRFKIRGYKF